MKQLAALPLIAITSCAPQHAAVPIADADKVLVLVHAHTPLGEELSRQVGNQSIAGCGDGPDTGTSKLAKKISASSEIAGLLNFANNRLGGYSDPWGGIPVAKVVIRFCQGKRLLAQMEAGPNYIARGNFPATRTRSASQSELLELARLSGIDASAVELVK